MTSLKQRRETRRQLGTLCGAAVQQQIKSGSAQPSQLRQRRRHLLKALRKHLPKSTMYSPEKILHNALMVLALWGFGGLAFPNTAQASAKFEHTMLEGFAVSAFAYPTFVDIDNDGDLDAFVGEKYGTVKFYQNNGSASVPSFAAANGTSITNPLFGFDVIFSALPTFADIDNDGDLDAFVGNMYGEVKFYRNNGSASAPSFAAANGTTIINPLAGFVNLTAVVAPTFADIDNDGDLDAFVGQLTGTVKFYQNNGTASAPNFVAVNGTTIMNPLTGFDVGYSAAPTFADIDNDGDLDAFVGEQQTGTVKFFQNNGTASSASFSASTHMLAQFDVGDFSSPTFADIDNDGDLDAFVGRSTGKVKFYQNNGSVSAPSFAAVNGTTIFNPLYAYTVSGYAQPVFADIDNDGDLDVFVGQSTGRVKFYQNNGSASAPAFTAVNGTTIFNPLYAYSVSGFAQPAFVDIDSDGDLDVFVGENTGTVKFYQNNGSVSVPNFVAADGITIINPLAGFNVGGYAVPTFADIDHDGDLDAFVGERGGTVKFYQNNGTASVPSFVAANGTTVINPLAGFDVGRYASPTFSDIDDDGDLDAFVGEKYGTVRFFENHECQPPVATDDTAATNENTVLTSSVSLLANDTDANGDTLSAVPGTFSTSQGGSIVIAADGSYTYTPPSTFTGTDTVSYTVSDGSLTDVGTLTITVNAAAAPGGSGGGGGAPGLPFLAVLAALLPWRKLRSAV